MPSVTVRGAAVAAVPPDRAIVDLGLTQVERDAAAALDKVAARSQQLEELLTSTGFTSPDWVTQGVQVAEEYEWKHDTNTLVGYRASAGVSVTVRLLDRVGPLLRDAVGNCGASVRGLTWHVNSDNPARLTVMADAAVDARLRATAYTTALGLRVGEIEWISEIEPQAEPAPREAMMMMRSAKAADSAPISVSGGQIELTAEVYVRFATLPAG